MRTHLLDAAKEYNQQANEAGIRPISRTDCEIIEEIGNLLFAKGEIELAQIIRKWKDEDDRNVIDSLMLFGESLDPETGESEKQTGKKSAVVVDFIKIDEYLLQAGMIVSLRPISKWLEGNEVFGLLLNEGPLPSKSNWFENTHIYFKSEEKRDSELESIKTKLSAHRNVRFL